MTLHPYRRWECLHRGCGAGSRHAVAGGLETTAPSDTREHAAGHASAARHTVVWVSGTQELLTALTPGEALCPVCGEVILLPRREETDGGVSEDWRPIAAHKSSRHPDVPWGSPRERAETPMVFHADGSGCWHGLASPDLSFPKAAPGAPLLCRAGLEIAHVAEWAMRPGGTPPPTRGDTP